jgi:hypothetical protein
MLLIESATLRVWNISTKVIITAAFTSMQDTWFTNSKILLSCYVYSVHVWEINPRLILFSGKVCFHFSENVHYRNNIFPLSFHKVFLYDVNVGVWCAMSATEIMAPVFFFETIISHACILYVQIQCLNTSTVTSELVSFFRIFEITHLRGYLIAYRGILTLQYPYNNVWIHR